MCHNKLHRLYDVRNVDDRLDKPYFLIVSSVRPLIFNKLVHGLVESKIY